MAAPAAGERGVNYELTVFPDYTQESLIHSRWKDVRKQSTVFINRFVREKQAPPVMSSSMESR